MCEADEDDVYGLLGAAAGQLKQLYESSRTVYDRYDNPKAADHLGSLAAAHGTNILLGSGSSGGRDRRSRGGAGYENIYDCIGHHTAKT